MPKTKQTVYQIVTNEAIKLLEGGTIPWQKPWTAKDDMPTNLISGKPYRGWNVWSLLMARMMRGYSSPYWLTYNQAKALGGNVKRGEKAEVVIFWKVGTREEKNENGELVTERSFLLRYYSAFNYDQCEGLSKHPPEPEERKAKMKPITAAEKLWSKWLDKPTVKHGGGRACYSPTLDTIEMPAIGSFHGMPEYYSTLFHEGVHATGHKKRLARTNWTETMFGSESYSKEELVAEMGAMFLMGHAGLHRKTIANSASYLKSWLSALKNDETLLVGAAAQAQRAADYIMGVKFEEAE